MYVLYIHNVYICMYTHIYIYICMYTHALTHTRIPHIDLATFFADPLGEICINAYTCIYTFHILMYTHIFLHVLRTH